MSLAELVRDKIRLLGVQAASEYFHVSTGTISNWLNGKTSPSIEAVELVLPDAKIAPDQTTDIEPKVTMWEGRKVAILMPSYRSFNPDTHWTLMANYARYGAEKIALIPPQKGTVIHEARNKLIDKVMKTDATSFIMVDDDMVLPFGEEKYFNNLYGANIGPKAGVNAISRIMSHPTECGIVGALYFGRHAAGKAQCEIGFRSSQESQKLRLGKYQSLVPTIWVGTGFIRIERWVIEKMKAAIDAGQFQDCAPRALDKWYGYFQPLSVGVGEDVSFGTRAQSLGIASYVDAGLVALHAGTALYGPNNTTG